MYLPSTRSHVLCAEPLPRIPAHMGWLWNLDEATQKGWKPGAISTVVRQIMYETKSAFLGKHLGRKRTALLRAMRKSHDKKSRADLQAKSRSLQMLKSMGFVEPEEEKKKPEPTLRVRRNNGDYYVTMNPIDQEGKDAGKVEDFNQKPMKVKIPKRQIKRSDSDSTVEDLDIEYYTPNTLNVNQKMPDVVHADTQVRERMIADAYKVGDVKKKKEKKVQKKGKK